MATKKTAKKATKKKTTLAKKAAPAKKARAVKKVTTKTGAKVTAVKKATKTATKKATRKKTAGSSFLKATESTSTIPAVGQLAPDFEITTDAGDVMRLSQFRGEQNVVLYFYPKDDTPGCTKQACAFQEKKSLYENANAVVVGVSPDDHASHTRFKTKYGLDFLLAVDTDHQLAETYGTWVEKNNYGKKYMGVQRTTFLIDRDGRVAYVWPKVSVDGHADAVLAELAQLS